MTINEITNETIYAMFPDTKRKAIDLHWPKVRWALTGEQLVAAKWGLMALATIRAETAGFVPISEGISKYNTIIVPFDLYDNRKDLGNGPHDGAKFKGRGFIQLTGRANYARIGERIGMGNDLLLDPELANHPVTAAQILAAFLKDKQAKIEAAIDKADLKKARKLVNGGSHGLAQFTEAFTTGARLLAGE